MSNPCYMCSNAWVDDELLDETDFSSKLIGKCRRGYRLSIDAGNGVPVRIVVETLDKKTRQNVTVAKYFPKYCPNCGRRLDEYDEE